MNSKKAKAFARKYSVVRVVVEIQNDYRWWRYQDAEPECGYVVDTTTYSTPAYPRPEKTKTRKNPRRSLSRRQLRKRLYGAGYRGDKLKAVFAEIIGFRAQSQALASMGDSPAAPAVQGPSYPFGWDMRSIHEKLGNRGWKVLAKGIHPLLVVLDEWGYYAAPSMVAFVKNTLATERKYGTAIEEILQEI